MNAEEQQGKRNQSDRRVEAKEEGKQKQHRGYMDHTFILPAECFVLFYYYYYFTLNYFQ